MSTNANATLSLLEGAGREPTPDVCHDNRPPFRHGTPTAGLSKGGVGLEKFQRTGPLSFIPRKPKSVFRDGAALGSPKIDIQTHFLIHPTEFFLNRTPSIQKM